MKNRIQSIDLIKIIAMLLVVMMHLQLAKYEAGLDTSMPYFIGPFTGIAIPLFFMVSGYLLCSKKAAFNYSIHKVYGIIKFCFIICMSFSAIMIIKNGSGDYLFFPKCFIQEGWFFQYWYLGAMIIIYMILPILKHIIDSHYFNYYIILFVFICFCVFILNVLYSFEKTIIQTFRLYNWIMYFLLGAFIKRNQERLGGVKCLYIIPSLLMYIIFFKYMDKKNNEYYFCSPMCIIHSSIVFISIINIKLYDIKIIDSLSTSFLPVYSFHIFISLGLCKYLPLFKILEDSIYMPLAYCIEYSITVFICLAFSYMLMRLNIARKIFAI